MECTSFGHLLNNLLIWHVYYHLITLHFQFKNHFITNTKYITISTISFQNMMPLHCQNITLLPTTLHDTITLPKYETTPTTHYITWSTFQHHTHQYTQNTNHHSFPLCNFSNRYDHIFNLRFRKIVRAIKNHPQIKHMVFIPFVWQGRINPTKISTVPLLILQKVRNTMKLGHPKM